MIKEERIASFKYSVLQHAQKYKNITYTCKVFHISKTIYYEWLKGFVKLGYLGLLDKKKRKPKMPNQIKPDKEKFILNYIIAYQTYGPKRIANELKHQGIKIIDTEIYKVLCRKQLNNRLYRLFYAQGKSDNPVITKRYLKGVAERKESHFIF